MGCQGSKATGCGVRCGAKSGAAKRGVVATLTADTEGPGKDEDAFLVDNSELKATAPGLYYRRKPSLDDTDRKGVMVRWGDTVNGTVTECGRFVKVGGRYLPLELGGCRVLRSPLGDSAAAVCAPVPLAHSGAGPLGAGVGELPCHEDAASAGSGAGRGPAEHSSEAPASDAAAAKREPWVVDPAAEEAWANLKSEERASLLASEAAPPRSGAGPGGCSACGCLAGLAELLSSRPSGGPPRGACAEQAAAATPRLAPETASVGSAGARHAAIAAQPGAEQLTELNTGIITCSEECVAADSEGDQAWHVLFRPGGEEVARRLAAGPEEEEEEEEEEDEDLQTLRDVFQACDANSDGSINLRELIKACRQRPEVATFFGLPSEIHQEGPSRPAVMEFFQGADADNDREITWEELCRFWRERRPATSSASPAPLSPPPQEAAEAARFGERASDEPAWGGGVGDGAVLAVAPTPRTEIAGLRQQLAAARASEQRLLQAAEQSEELQRAQAQLQALRDFEREHPQMRDESAATRGQLEEKERELAGMREERARLEGELSSMASREQLSQSQLCEKGTELAELRWQSEEKAAELAACKRSAEATARRLRRADEEAQRLCAELYSARRKAEPRAAEAPQDAASCLERMVHASSAGGSPLGKGHNAHLERALAAVDGVHLGEEDEPMLSSDSPLGGGAVADRSARPAQVDEAAFKQWEASVIEAFFCEKMAVVENDAEGQEAAESVLVAAADVFNRTGSYYVRGPGGVAAIQDDLAGLYCAVSRDGVVPDCDAHATSAQHHFHSARSAPT